MWFGHFYQPVRQYTHVHIIVLKVARRESILLNHKLQKIVSGPERYSFKKRAIHFL